jgi:hypothetical protein
MLPSGRLGFHLGRYDHTAPLVIDPVLSYSTYFGSGADVKATGIAVDSTGNAYIVGFDGASSFIPIKNAYQATGDNYSDGFVAKINPTGTDLIYSTYFGGKGIDEGQAIAVDGANNAYVTGRTTSKDFPGITPSVSDPGSFVIKFSSAGNALLYSHVDSNNGHVSGADAIVVDGSGNAYYTGDQYHCVSGGGSYAEMFIN